MAPAGVKTFGQRETSKKKDQFAPLQFFDSPNKADKALLESIKALAILESIKALAPRHNRDD